MRHIRFASSLAFLLAATTGCDTGDRATIGPRGGMIVSDDGRFSVEVPQGALDREVWMTVERIDCTPDEAIGSCYAVEPRGTLFSRPAVVTYELGGMPLDSVDPHHLFVFAARDDGWNPLADRDVDMDDEIVTASALYTTDFALVVQP